MKRLLLAVLLASFQTACWADGVITAPGASRNTTFTTSTDHTTTLPNSRRWVNGTNTTVDLSTSGQIKINAVVGAGSVTTFLIAGAAVVGFNLVNTTGGAFSLAIPTAVGSSGLTIEVKHTLGAPVCTLTPFGAETIDSAASFPLSILDAVILKSDGANWWII